mgnify:CR=1 FL=1
MALPEWRDHRTERWVREATSSGRDREPSREWAADRIGLEVLKERSSKWAADKIGLAVLKERSREWAADRIDLAVLKGRSSKWAADKIVSEEADAMPADAADEAVEAAPCGWEPSWRPKRSS